VPASLPPETARQILSLASERPIAVFDIEATGADRLQDRIVEIAVLRFFEGGVTTLSKRVDPGIRIPKESTAVHGITDEDVKGLPRFADIAAELAGFLAGCDLAGYSLRGFDLPVLLKEFDRAGVAFTLQGRRILDAQTIFFKKEPRDLSAALRLFAGREHDGAHSALGDAVAAAEVLAGELSRYADLPREVEALAAFSTPSEGRYVDPDKRFLWRDGQAIFAFGEYRGSPLRKVAEAHPEYLDWILSKDFSAETKRIVREAQRGVYPARG
jgi:DNA polymerase-3 subunit epsilon